MLVKRRVGEVLDPINDLTDWFDIRKKIDRLGTKMERFTADAVYLMVVFIFQTIFIPMLTLWLLIKSITILHPTPRPRAAAED